MEIGEIYYRLTHLDPAMRLPDLLPDLSSTVRRARIVIRARRVHKRCPLSGTSATVAIPPWSS